MIFSPESIKAIIAGTKSQTRRLVKEGELLGSNEGILEVCIFERKLPFYKGVKWQVGKVYSVQSGRGKPTVWYQIVSRTNQEDRIYFSDGQHSESVDQKPLKICLLSIRKEWLLDISEEDAKKEGYSGIADFLEGFLKINKQDTTNLTFWNPEIWVLEFEKV